MHLYSDESLNYLSSHFDVRGQRCMKLHGLGYSAEHKYKIEKITGTVTV